MIIGKRHLTQLLAVTGERPGAMSRRGFLSTAAAFTFGLGALNLGTVRAQTAPAVSGTSAGPESYLGNPNIRVTSIDTSGGIAWSRAGEAMTTPAFVQVSASNIRCIGTVVRTDGTTTSLAVVPYEDLEYWWDFGDPKGAEILTSPVTGKTVNANNQQYGPEAVYCYRSAGSYLITLHVRAKFSSSAYISASITQQVAVSDFSSISGALTYYVDMDNGNNAWDGRYPDHSLGGNHGPLKTNLTPVELAARARILLKRGCTNSFPRTSAFNWNGNLLRLGTYGSGSPPIMTGQPQVFQTRNTAARNDIVISGIVFQAIGTGSGTTVATVDVTGSSPVTNYYFDNCLFTTELYIGNGLFGWTVNGGQNKLSKAGWWNTSYHSPVAIGSPANKAIGGSAKDWHFWVGGSIEGSGANEVLDHHWYPDTQTHMCVRWVNFGSGLKKCYCINTNFDGQKPLGNYQYAEFYDYAECVFSGTEFAGWDASSGTGGTQSYFRNFVVERCNVHSINGAFGHGSYSAYTGGCISMTMRDCLLWNLNLTAIYSTGAGLTTPGPPPVMPVYREYRNKLYRARATATGMELWRNGGGVHQFTDNSVQDMRSAPSCAVMGCSWKSQRSLGSLFDRNNYYTPNAPGSKQIIRDLDGDSFKTLAQFQAYGGGGFFEPISTTDNPGWINPANGNFNT